MVTAAAGGLGGSVRRAVAGARDADCDETVSGELGGEMSNAGVSLPLLLAGAVVHSGILRRGLSPAESGTERDGSKREMQLCLLQAGYVEHGASRTPVASLQMPSSRVCL